MGTAKARRVAKHLTMTLDELTAWNDTRSTHRMVDPSMQSEAPSTEQTARRVPMHLTITLDELTAWNDTRSTHRMVDPSMQSETQPAERMARRVPMHLTMTLNELIASKDIRSAHRMVGGIQAEWSADSAKGIDELFAMMKQCDEQAEARRAAQRHGIDSLFDLMREADAKWADTSAYPEMVVVRETASGTTRTGVQETHS